jgi:hypothetical protein
LLALALALLLLQPLLLPLDHAHLYCGVGRLEKSLEETIISSDIALYGLAKCRRIGQDQAET